MPALDGATDDPQQHAGSVDKTDVDSAEDLLNDVQGTGRCLQRFDADELRVLAENISVFRFEKDELIMKEGETATWMGVVLSGTLCAVAKEDGRELNRLSKGQLVGELAFFCGGVRFCDVRAASDGFLAALQFHEMTGLFSRLCALAAAFGTLTRAHRHLRTLMPRCVARRWRPGPTWRSS